MKLNAEQVWEQVFGAKDPDTILNRFDAMIESEEYAQRVEGFMDAVEDMLGDQLKGKEITEMARALLEYAESRE